VLPCASTPRCFPGYLLLSPLVAGARRHASEALLLLLLLLLVVAPAVGVAMAECKCGATSSYRVASSPSSSSSSSSPPKIRSSSSRAQDPTSASSQREVLLPDGGVEREVGGCNLLLPRSNFFKSSSWSFPASLPSAVVAVLCALSSTSRPRSGWASSVGTHSRPPLGWDSSSLVPFSRPALCVPLSFPAMAGGQDTVVSRCAKVFLFSFCICGCRYGVCWSRSYLRGIPSGFIHNKTGTKIMPEPTNNTVFGMLVTISDGISRSVG
jgi:hypothetical protein